MNTAIGQCAVSVPYAAVELAKQIFGTLDERKILLMGAGKMSELSARYLKKNGVTDVRVINRTLENARELANKLGELRFRSKNAGHTWWKPIS